MTRRLELVERARQFRREPTATERMLWEHLRARQLGSRAYRQHVVGPFVADFCFLRAKLIVEIDGRVHDDQRERDEERDAYLRGQGFRILRVSADDVEHRLPSVIERIRAQLDPSAVVD